MPEEKQRKSIRVGEIDKMINKLQSLERVDGTSENNAIAYLSDLANHLDRIGVKTIKMRPEAATSSGAHNKKLN